MATEILMPRQGQSVESCIIIKWNANEGESINEGDTLCEVETDKASFEVESTASGTLLAILYPADADVEVLKPIAIVGDIEEDISSYLNKKDSIQNEEKKINVITIPNNEKSSQNNTDSNILKNKQIAYSVGASPRAKKLALEKKISLNKVSGTGPDGRIIARDVISNEQASLPSEILGAYESVPAKGIRKIVSDRMLDSLQLSAQLTLNASADATKTLELRKICKKSINKKFNSVSVNDILLFCVVYTLKEFSDFNAHWIEEKLFKFEDIHIGFAVDTPKGLMVPVIKNAHHLNLNTLSEKAKILASSCLDGSINPDDLTGATFTVTNLGSMGIESFTPVLNLPEVAILGICSINPKPVMQNEKVEFIPHMGLSLTFNHCALDGAPAARFLSALKKNIFSIDALLSSSIF